MRTLWLDDSIETSEFQELRRSVEASLGNVVSVSTEESFEEARRSRRYDLYLLDLRLGARQGLDVARELLAECGDVPIIFLSEFGTQYRDYRTRLDPRARTRLAYKPLQDPQGWAHRELRTLAREILREDPGSSISWEGPPPDLDAWKSGPALFQALPLDDQLRMLNAASAALASYTDALFSESPSTQYVVIVGPRPRVVLFGGMDGLGPSEDHLRDIESRHHCVPITVYRPVQIEEVVDGAGLWAACSFQRDVELQSVDMYPTLTIEINGHVETCHFDSGNPWTYMGYEHAIAANAISPAVSYYAWRTQTMSSSGVRATVNFCQPQIKAAASSRGGFMSVSLRPRFLKDWIRSPLAKICDAGRCPGSELSPRGGFICGSRRGLIGRDILRDNQLLIILDSINRRSFVAESFDELHEDAELDEWELT